MPQLAMTMFAQDVYVATIQALTMGPDISYQWGFYKATSHEGVLTLATVYGATVCTATMEGVCIENTLLAVMGCPSLVATVEEAIRDRKTHLCKRLQQAV